MDGDGERAFVEGNSQKRSQRPHQETPSRPDRKDFGIAIMCALPLEATAARGLFDKYYDDDVYTKSPNDPNAYSTGVIGCHNVVLVHMSGMGKVAAATAAAFILSSFPGVRLALVVGICGGAPYNEKEKKEILLGDVVLSEGLIQYDFGRQCPNNQFLRKDTPRDNLPRPNPELRAVLAKLQTEQGRFEFHKNAMGNLEALRNKLKTSIIYPGETNERLFKSNYQHMHHNIKGCSVCDINDACEEAAEKSCKELKCSLQEVVCRARVSEPFKPDIHFGLMASGDTVMKSGEDRDAITARDNVIAFEMEGAGMWEVFNASLIIKGVCDYADSHKSKKWQGYAAATAAAVTKSFLENWKTDYPRGSPSPLTDKLKRGRVWSDGETEILQKLYKSPYEDRKDRNPDRIPGTCEWFTTHSLFRDWHQSKSSRMLWVSADPGCGKSVLAKYLIDDALQTSENRITCYFFFKDDFEDQKNITNALCCILHQIFQQKPTLFSQEVFDDFRIRADFTNSFSALWRTLINVAQDEDAGEILCILDALDECDDKGGSQLIQALCKLYGSERSLKCKLKFLLTSRPYPKIQQQFHPLEITLPVIHLSGESEAEMKKIAHEIDIYVKAKVELIGSKMGLRHGEQDLLLQELMRVSNRTYLWVHLTISMIEKNIDVDGAAIVDITSRLPRTVDEAYERILSRSSNIEKAKRLLHIIVAAERPLTLKEMNVALLITKNHQSYKELDIKQGDRFGKTIRDLCGLFVMVVDSKVYLLHQTAKEFLVQNDRESGIQDNLQWKGSLIPHESHSILREICMWYLFLSDFENVSPDTESAILDYVENHIFLGYASRFWTAHFHKSPFDPKKEIQSLTKLCDTSSSRCQVWVGVYWASTHTIPATGFTSLMIASYFGIEIVVENLLKLDVDLNAQDTTYGRSALSWASGNGLHKIVKRLVRGKTFPVKGNIPIPFQKGVEINSRDKENRTPLSYAAWSGHAETVKLLLRKGAEVSLVDRNNGTALSYAICSGHDAVVSLLLGKNSRIEPRDEMIQRLLTSAVRNGDGAVVQLLLDGVPNLESRDNAGRTLISLAICNGHQAVVHLLLDRGANLESRDNAGRTLISLAICNAHQAVVHLLLDRGANLESRDNNGWTPLFWAVYKRHQAVVHLLLDRGANLESRDNNGRTPLSWAAQYGREVVAQLLLDNGADLKSGDNDGRTPFFWAVYKGHQAVIQLLLDRGANLESRDKIGWTPLSWAVYSGYKAVIQLLLDRGADLEVTDIDGRTPLSRVAQYGHEAVIQLLLDRGANLEATDSNGRTPLSWAAQYGREVVAQLLLDNGADLESRDNDGRTPLFWATYKGRRVVIQLLLVRGANLESRDNNGRTPLSWAAQYGREVVAQLLLDNGADLESGDNDGRTPLSWAACNKCQTVVQLLLDRGADLESRDNDGVTPLSWTAYRGYQTVIQLLLDRGANLESRDKDGETPLSLAVCRGCLTVVQLLLERGANLESRDNNGWTPLFQAVHSGYEAVIQLLLDRGADLESRDNDGHTPLS